MEYISAILLPILHGTSNIIDGQLSTRHIKDPVVLLFFVRLTYPIIVIAFLLIFGLPQIPNVGSVALVVVAAALDSVAAIPFFAAYKHADTSVVTAYLALGKIFTPIVAFIVLGEMLAPLQYFGFAIIIIASVLAGAKSLRKFKINRGFFLMLLVALLSTLQVVILKIVTRETDAHSTTLYLAIAKFVLPLFLLFIPQKRTSIVSNVSRFRSLLWVFILLAVLNISGWLASIHANAGLPVVVVSSINSIRPLFVMAVSIVVGKIMRKQLNERHNQAEITKKVFCFIAIILGVVLAVRL